MKKCMTSVALSALLFSSSWGGVIENLPMPDKNSAKTQSSKTFVKREDYKLGLGLKHLIELKASDTGYIDDAQSIDVVVTVQDLTPDDEKERLDTIDQVDAMATFDEGKATYVLNDKKVTLDTLKKVAKTEKDKNDKWLEKITQRRNKNIAKLAKKYGWEEHKSIKKALKEGASSFSVSLTKEQIKELYSNNQDVIAIMDLPKKLESSNLGSAMLTTKVDPFAINYSDSRGSGIGIYINEVGTCPSTDIDQFQTNYTLLTNVTVTDTLFHSIPVGGSIRKIAPDADLFCNNIWERGANRESYMNPFPALSIRNSIQVESYSFNAYNGIEDSDFTYNTDYQDIDAAFDNYVYDNNKYVFVSAGNRKSSTANPNDYVLSPAKAFNVITVGNYNDATLAINQDGTNTSSWGNPSTGNQKPEISGPGTNIVYEYTITDTDYFGNETTTSYSSGPWTGTSFATPHAAAFAADAISHNSFLNFGRASMMKAHMIASATDVIGGGRDRVGEGGINFYSSKIKSKSLAHYSNGNSESPFPYIGTNSSGDWYCKTNWSSHFNASDSKARVVIAWLNRGDFILANGETGIDLDLHVKGPNGEWYYGEMNDNDPYAMVTFDPPTTGTYTAYICKTKDIDSLSRIDLGYAAVSY